MMTMVNTMMQNSIWLPHPNYPGYLFSPEGNCLSTKGTAKLLKPNKKKNGYLQFALTTNGKTVHLSAHRLIAQIYCEGFQPHLQVNHKNGIKHDNHAENLEWVTAKENKMHSFEVLGRRPARGESVSGVKLTEDQVILIIKLINDGTIYREIAEKFNVNRKAISLIAAGKNWKHITDKHPITRKHRYKNSKLTSDQALEIKKELSKNNQRGTINKLAAQYGVGRTQVSRIGSGLRWKGLSNP